MTRSFFLRQGLAGLRVKLIWFLNQPYCDNGFSTHVPDCDLGAHKGWPDLQVCSPSNLFGDAQVLHGLFVELKDNGCSPFRVDGKGLLANDRAILQAQTLAGLCKQGYLGAFAVGEDQAKLLIDAYLGDTNARKAIKIQREIVPGGWIYRLK